MRAQREKHFLYYTKSYNKMQTICVWFSRFQTFEAWNPYQTQTQCIVQYGLKTILHVLTPTYRCWLPGQDAQVRRYIYLRWSLVE